MERIPEEDQVILDDFLKCCKQCGERPKTIKDGVIYLYGTVFLGSLYLDFYKTDIFNSHFPLIVIDTNKNIIKLWGKYGPKVEVKGEYKYNFGAIEPTFTIKGLLKEGTKLCPSQECPED